MQTFWTAFLITLTSEMGDKSQLVALGFATRFRLRDILLGLMWSISLVMLVSTGIGRLVAHWVPVWLVHALAATLFLFFAARSFQEDDEEAVERAWNFHPILLTGLTLFLTEFGDKTMFATAALAGTSQGFPVWMGSTLGMFTVDGLTVLAGKAVGDRIPPAVLKAVGLALFVGFGLWNGYLAFKTF